MSIKVNCLNPIAACGLDMLGDNYEITENTNEAEAILVRSAGMHDMDLPESLLAVARAGAGVNNIPLDACAEKGIVVFYWLPVILQVVSNGARITKTMRILQNPEKKQRKHSPEQKLKERNLVLSVLVQLVY